MKQPSSSPTQNDESQLGGTDQIEQLAADMAVKEGRPKVTDADREKAHDQMEDRSPPPAPGPEH